MDLPGAIRYLQSAIGEARSEKREARRKDGPGFSIPDSQFSILGSVDWGALSDLLIRIEKGSSIKQVCASLVKQLTKSLPKSVAAIWLLKPTKEGRPSPTLTLMAGRGEPLERLTKQGPIALGAGLIGQAAGGRETICIEDIRQIDNPPEDLRTLVGPDGEYASVILVPIKTWAGTLGVIMLLGMDSTPAQPPIRAFLETLAYGLGNFVEQLRAMEIASRQNVVLTRVGSMIESIGRSSNLAHICDNILHNVAESLSTSHGALFLRDPGENTLRLFRHRGLDDPLIELGQTDALEKWEEGLSRLDRGEPLNIADFRNDPLVTSRRVKDLLRTAGLRSGVVLPLQSHQELIGLLMLGSKEPGHFSHYSSEFLSIITNRIAATIEPHAQSATRQAPGADPQAPGAIPEDSTAVQLHETLLENLSSGVLAVDGDGRITIFNPAMERLTEYTAVEVVGRSIRTDRLKLFPQNNPFDDALTKGRTISQEEAQVLVKSGGHKYVSMIVMPLTDEDGRAVGAVGLFTDMTQVRALEHERYRLTPLALIGEMSARLAHEIKNPLASMMSGLELLKRRLKYGDREARYFERLIAELRRLDTTVREMLAYSRTAPPTLSPVDPAHPVERALDTLMPQLEAARIQVTQDYQPEPHSVLMDDNQMEQVFLNLILNAIHAMPDGGELKISVRTSPQSRDEGQVTSDEPKDDSSLITHHSSLSLVEYAVSDTGMGIPPDALDKIFDPFFSTKTHGTGLGLASVKKIIESHQGEISVESEAGAGTTFLIRLISPQLTEEPASA